MGNCLHPSKEKTLTISDGQTGEVKPISNGHVPAGGGQPHPAYLTRQHSDTIDWEEIRQETERQLAKNISDDMREKPEQLIVNFLLMSVQFLENYEKYKKQLITQENDEEEEINKALADKKKSCLLPGGLASKSFEYISVQSEDNSDVYTPLEGNPVLIFYNNIEVKENINDADDVSEHYIDLEDPNYRLGFEPSQRHVGFVKMRCKDDPSKYNRTPQTPNSVLSPSSASVASEVEMPESVVVDPDNFVMNRFIESTSAEHRKSFDESHPRNLPHLHQKPSAELRRSSSFKDQIISETDDDDDDDDDDGDTGADFMKKLGEKVNSQQAQTMLHSQYQFAPVREGVRPASSRAMSPPPAPATSSSLTVPGERDQRRSSRASSRGSLGTMGSGSEFGYAVTKPRSLASEYESARHSLIPNDCFHSKHVPLRMKKTCLMMMMRTELPWSRDTYPLHSS